MSVSIYQASVPVFVQMLGSLDALLEKAQAYTSAKGLEPHVLLQLRLYPDMFAFVRQVQIASDFARGISARLAGQEPPSLATEQNSLAQLRELVQNSLSYLAELKPADFDNADTREIVLRPGTPKERRFTGQSYLLSYGLPQFFFHITTCYALLRHAGVEVGKKDYMGKY